MLDKKGNNISNGEELGEDKDQELMPISHNSPDKQIELEDVLKKMLPYVGSNLNNLVLTQVMIVLKLENILDNSANDDEKQMIKLIKDSIMSDPDKRHQTLRLIQKLLK